jgi:hypothetical protein
VAIVGIAAVASCSSNADAAPSSPTTPAQALKSNLGRPLNIGTEPTAGAPCETGDNGGPLVTESCVDPALNKPYVDLDERRTITDPATRVTVNVRYVHGGFTGTAGKFSFYFPDRYAGRFFESTYPTLSTEDADPATVVFAISNNSYVVSDNNAGGLPAGGVIAGYELNAASAKFSRVVAAQVYGDSARPRGYLYGASGGAYQTLAAMENTNGVYDGAVPMVPGTSNALPSNLTVESLGLRVLKDKLPQIDDAMEPGGSGDPYAGLDAEQQAVLRETARLGFPLNGWWDYANMSPNQVAAIGVGVRVLDPTYVDDFWTKPGYAGTDPASSVAKARIQYMATVTGLVGSPPTGLELSGPPTGDLTGADIDITSGAAAGKSVALGSASGNTLTFERDADASVTSAIKLGDQVRLDNSWYLALQYYQRHQVPPADQGLTAWDQFRDASGKPLYPQRAALTGPVFAQQGSGGIPTGRFHGKMIMLASTLDALAFPWSADWYRQQAKAILGSNLDGSYRLWYMDNAGHSPPPTKAALTHIVSYDGELQQALLDLDAWVTRGTAPPATTGYTIDEDTQIHLASTADQRYGVQPVVGLSITKVGNDKIKPAVRADARTGQAVTLSVDAREPPDAGRITRVEWDFDGTGSYSESSRLGKIDGSVRLTTNHVFTKPGTYFAVVRVTSQRQGDAGAAYTLVQNLGRVRIVVKSKVA